MGSRPDGFDLAGNNFRDGLTAGLTWIPGLHDGAHRIPPGHGCRIAGLEHDNRVRIGGRDGGNHRILAPRQRKVGTVEPLSLTRIPNTMTRSARRAASTASPGLMPGSNSI